MTSVTHSRPRPDDVAYVARVWFELCERHGIPGPKAVGLFTDLLLAYSEEGRGYHDLRHIRECLEVLDANVALADYPDALRWAILFHDIVYDTTVDDGLNVAASAERAIVAAREAGLPDDLAHTSGKLVMATTHTDDDLASSDERLIADIDLVVLAWPWEIFCEYGERIRREYPWATDAEYREGRAAFFENMLAKPRLYLTEQFRDRYEMRARANIERGLAEIRSGS